MFALDAKQIFLTYELFYFFLSFDIRRWVELIQLILIANMERVVDRDSLALVYTPISQIESDIPRIGQRPCFCIICQSNCHHKIVR